MTTGHLRKSLGNHSFVVGLAVSLLIFGPMLRRMIPRRLLFFRMATPLLPLTARIGIPSNGLSRAPLLHFLRTSSPRLASPPPTSPPSDLSDASLPPNATLSQRLKFLMKSYGWYAAGVYLVLSALDFTVAFIGISLLGAEQVSQAATYVKVLTLRALHTRPLEPGKEEQGSTSAMTGSREGLYAVLVLAYTIHKTLFLPVRIGLTAAMTPRLVGWLRMRGWVGR